MADLAAKCKVIWLSTKQDEASSGARGAPALPTATGPVEFLVFSF